MLKKVCLALVLAGSGVCYANAADQLEQNQKFNELLNKTRQELSRYVPLAYYGNYHVVGEETPEALLNKLTKMKSPSDICFKGLGSLEFCSNQKVYINQHDVNNNVVVATSLPMELKKMPSGFGEYVALGLNNQDSLQKSRSKAVLNLASNPEYLNRYPFAKSLSTEGIVSATLRSIFDLAAQDEAMGELLNDIDIRKHSLTEEQILELGYLGADLAGAMLKQVADTVKHCQIPKDIKKSLNQMHEGELYQIWTTNKEVEKYSQCIENAINNKKLTNEVRSLFALVDFYENMRKNELFHQKFSHFLIDMMEGSEGERLSKKEREIIEDFIEAILSDKHNIKFGVKRIQIDNNRATALVPDIQLPISINNKNCNANNKYCENEIKLSVSQNNYPLVCKINKKTIDIEFCIGVLETMYEINGAGFVDNFGLGIDYWTFLGQQLYDLDNFDKDIPIQSDFQMLQAMIAHAKQLNQPTYSQANMNIRLKKVQKSTMLDKKDVWVVENIDFNTK